MKYRNANGTPCTVDLFIPIYDFSAFVAINPFHVSYVTRGDGRKRDEVRRGNMLSKSLKLTEGEAASLGLEFSAGQEKGRKSISLPRAFL